MLPEDLMLLFLDEETGRVLMDTASIHTALAGAVLLELVSSGRVAFDADGVKLAVVDPAPLQNELLQESLIRFYEPMEPTRAVKRLLPHVRDNVMAQLVDQGVLTLENTRMFGIFPTKRYVIQDPQAISDLRDAICKAALRRRAPDEHIGALMSLLYAVNAVYEVFHGDIDRGEINARAGEIADGDWAAEAVALIMDTASRATSWRIVASSMAAASFGGSR
ncbi:Golgi phosphoprotein 3 (GPP34) [Lentzea waywayandensis]|uniref:Golgi phosphoprotein 3 (GPP34) n=1 Tax=Lentzea waywayandensis TaxID=84724 RepID=A0A1I6EF59_9PSEU|nr:GPP34 family phosphoprotein [Lentzea waywayandensis]SFR16132.1 Golgi phosphoprotein 3 (GPP34) [Lentzea waywayandensis]